MQSQMQALITALGSMESHGLSAASFIFSLNRRSFLVAGLLVIGGVVSVTYAAIVISMMANMAPSVSGHSPIHLVWDGLAVLGLGVAKGIETRRIAAKRYEKNI